MSASQLPLALAPPRRPAFDNFVAGENRAVLRTLRDGPAPGDWFFLSGPPGSGKTHLAQACVRGWSGPGRPVAFVPGSSPRAADLLRATSGQRVIVDDVDALAGSSEGERALFNALVRWQAERCGVLMTGKSRRDFELPDLASRVSRAARLVLRPLGDAGLERLIDRLVADHDVVAGRGLVAYLLRHGPRSGGELARLFERMSLRARSERRVLSVPLARSVLESFENDGAIGGM
ncbi:MAG: hypothetical protein R3323_08455 [Wenzhouxiangellaceae bacterium]|nr:hypothetical protein [Wenzhouxiangellaceae bacterium]